MGFVFGLRAGRGFRARCALRPPITRIARIARRFVGD